MSPAEAVLMFGPWCLWVGWVIEDRTHILKRLKGQP